MLTLSNSELAVTLTLDVVGYESPEASDNWLLLKVNLTQADKRFDRIDPALECIDIKRIHEWFSALSERRLPSSVRLWFTEPCLGLECYGHWDGRVRIAVNLACELRPPFLLRARDAGRDEWLDEELDGEEWSVWFDLTEDDFFNILAKLESYIQHYPARR